VRTAAALATSHASTACDSTVVVPVYRLQVNKTGGLDAIWRKAETQRKPLERRFREANGIPDSIPDYCTGSMLFGEKIATSATQGLSAITDEDDLEPDSVVTDCSSRKTAAGNKFKMGLNVFQKIGRQSHERRLRTRMRDYYDTASTGLARCAGSASIQEIVIKESHPNPDRRTNHRTRWADSTVPYSIGMRLRNAPIIDAHNFASSSESAALDAVVSYCKQNDYEIKAGSWTSGGIKVDDQDRKEAERGSSSELGSSEADESNSKIIKRFKARTRRLSVTDQIAVSLHISPPTIP